MKYPRKIKIENAKLKQLLAEKDNLVMQGRKLNETIDTYVENMKEVEAKLIEEEKKVDISMFEAEAEECTNEMNALMAKMQSVQKKMFDYIKENTPQELRTEYEEIEKKKKEAELKLNKVTMQTLKYGDRITPIVLKEGAKFIENEYEEIEGIAIEKGELVLNIYSTLEEFKARIAEKKKA